MTAFLHSDMAQKSKHLKFLEGGGGGCMSLSRAQDCRHSCACTKFFFGGFGPAQPTSGDDVFFLVHWSAVAHATGSKKRMAKSASLCGAARFFPFVMEVGVRLSQEELGRSALCVYLPLCKLG